MALNIYLLAGIVIVATVFGAPDPLFNKCVLSDSKCLKESTAAGIPLVAMGLPELGVETLDPYFFKHLDASTNQLKLYLDDLTVKGLKDCVSKKVQYDESKSKLTIRVLCDIVVDGRYEMKGRLVVLPIEGKDKLHIDLRKIQINAVLDLVSFTGADDKEHWDIKSWKHTFDLKDRATVVFENLFPGNELLGRTAREVVASSGNEIIIEVGPPVIKEMVSIIAKNVNNLFHKVPLEDLKLN